MQIFSTKKGPTSHYSDLLFYMDHPALPIFSPGSFYFREQKVFPLKQKLHLKEKLIII